MPPDPTGKWTEIELLPNWEEEFYDVYTAKKHGRWVMLKALKAQHRDDPHFRHMLEKEFEVRYNLAHPNIIMINDLEEIPGLGKCIITDDVFGTSLRKLIDEGSVTTVHIDKLATQLVEAIDYIQRNHLIHFPIRPETIIFTDNIENLKLIDVGYDQRESITPADAAQDLQSFGQVMTEALDACHDNPNPHLRHVAQRALASPSKHGFQSVHGLRMALQGRSHERLYIAIIIFLAAMVAILALLLSKGMPAS